MPEQDRIANAFRCLLPERWAYGLSRWKNIVYLIYVYQLAQHFPNFVKAAIVKMVRKELGPDYDVATHFTPRYNPWDQRLCLVPDSDLFLAIKAGRASVVTGQIERFTERGIRLQSGRELDADIVVTATGLVLQAFGGADLEVDGQVVELGKTLAYKGVMFSGVPNLASIFGYINASWTLKADLICAYVCRLLNLMDRKGVRQVMPRNGHEAEAAPFIEGFTPGYMERAIANWPKQGAKAPWRVYQNYIRDILSLKWSPVDNEALKFSNPPQVTSNLNL
jgi:cation diffusion facilitator CzcD-associated flavoprotein CzcO